MKQILLSHGKFALIDDEDFERINKYKWYVIKHRYTFYAIRLVCEGGKIKEMCRMHREIMKLCKGDGVKIDHKNRNGLDNQKNNLRIASNSINGYNSKLKKNNTSGYRGVFKYNKNKWYAQIQFNRKFYRSKSFLKKEIAAMEYDRMALQFYGSNAMLNFPQEGEQ